MSLFVPNASRVDVAGGGSASGTPAQTGGNLWRNVDEGRLPKDAFATLSPAAPSDADYVTLTGLGAGKRVWFKFSIPGYYNNKSYGDGLTMVDSLTIISLTVRLRIRMPVTPTSCAILISRDGGTTIGQIGADFTPTTSFAWVEQTATLDPLTGAQWRSQDLSTPTEISFSTSESGDTDVSVFHIETSEALGGGLKRARLGPLLKEPALFCAVCNEPKHLRDLVQVADPDSLQDGWYVCKADYDEVIRPEREELFLTEGDIDHDL